MDSREQLHKMIRKNLLEVKITNFPGTDRMCIKESIQKIAEELSVVVASIGVKLDTVYVVTDKKDATVLKDYTDAKRLDCCVM